MVLYGFLEEPVILSPYDDRMKRIGNDDCYIGRANMHMNICLSHEIDFKDTAIGTLRSTQFSTRDHRTMAAKNAAILG